MLYSFKYYSGKSVNYFTKINSYPRGIYDLKHGAFCKKMIKMNVLK